MEDYEMVKKHHQKEVNEFPIMFAFSQKQFEEGLKKLGVSEAKKELLSIGAGGFIRKTDADAFKAMYRRHWTEMDKAMEDDSFMLKAMEFELSNHEYCYLMDPRETMETLGLSLDDPRVERLFRIAEHNYMTEAIAENRI